MSKRVNKASAVRFPCMERIISGGQTGADRAALDFAIENKIPHGGWCPLGRLAEDGTIPRRYKLEKTPQASYPQRTEWNVRDSDATVIFSLSAQLVAGSKLTFDIARRLGKPCLHVSRKRDGLRIGIEKLEKFLTQNKPTILNVAGPRASTEPRIGEFVSAVLSAVLQQHEKC